jgi:hypothetical protein
MSYELFFKPREGAFDPARLRHYLRHRPNYAVEGKRAFYANENTGVYFWFDLLDRDEQPGEEHYPVAFEINYFRPSYFIREAEPEVAALVGEFDWTVLDTQNYGMGEGEYQGDLLVAGWNFGNEFAFSDVNERPEAYADVAFLPTSTLTRIWEWNHDRSAQQARLGRAQFVPLIKFFRLDGKLITAAIWPDASPAILPIVDYLLILREELAPRRFFRKSPDQALVAWDEALPILTRHASRHDADIISLEYDQPPPEVIDFIRSLPTADQEMVNMPAYQVLDRDLVGKFAARKTRKNP